ncbi:MAG TPA: hypothetical protein VGD01_12020 [Candidatus Elarobacter sp.]|jgi:hypothetical protein
MSIRFWAMLVSAIIVLAANSTGTAQTTTAPTTQPVVGPTAVATAVPGSISVPATTATMHPPQKPGSLTMPLPAGGPLALDARYLRGTRTASGYRLTGQAEVNDACMAARFSQFLGNIFPPQFNVVQYRRPDRMGMLCIQRLAWVTVPPLNVTSAAPPRYVTIRTQKGYTRVPILPGPV